MTAGLPNTLCGRFMLVDGEPRRRPFGKRSKAVLFDSVLHAAALCDLYFGGQLIDRLVLDQIPSGNSADWAQVVSGGVGAELRILAREVLRTAGWLDSPHRRLAGIIAPAPGPPTGTVREELMREVRHSLDGMAAGRPLPPRTKALGLLAHYAQLPAAASPSGGPRLFSAGMKITAAGIAPLAGLADALSKCEIVLGDIWGAGARIAYGGCGGGGGGGCGGGGGGSF